MKEYKLGRENMFYIRGNRSVEYSIVSESLDSALLQYFDDKNAWLPKEGEMVTIMNKEGLSSHLKVKKIHREYSIDCVVIVYLSLGKDDMHVHLLTQSIGQLCKEIRNLAKKV